MCFTLTSGHHGFCAENDSTNFLIKRMETNLHQSESLYRSYLFDSSFQTIELNLDSAYINSQNSEVRELILKSYQQAINVLNKSHKLEEAIILGNEALRLGDIDHSRKCHIIRLIGNSHRKLGRLNEAKIHSNRIIDICQKNIVEGSDWHIATAYQALGLIYMRENNLKRAKNCFLYSFKYFNPSNSNSNQLLQAYGNVSILYSQLNELDSSLHYAQKSLEVLDDFIGTPLESRIPLFKALIFTNISDVYFRKGDTSEALELSKEAVNIYSAMLGEDSNQAAWARSVFGQYLVNAGRHQEAIAQLQKALQGIKKIYPDDNSKSIFCYVNLGEAYRNLGDPKKALRYYDSALLNNPKLAIHGNWIYSDTQNAILSLQYRLQATAELNDVDYRIVLDSTYKSFLTQAQYINAVLSHNLLDLQLMDFASTIIESYDSIYEISGDHAAIDKIWHIMEITKARSLSAQHKLVGTLANLPDEIREEERTLRDSIQLLMSQKLNFNKDSLIYLLDNRLASLHEAIKKKYPKYYNATSIAKIKDPGVVQNALKNNELLMTFFQHKDQTYILLITKTEIHLDRIKNGDPELLKNRITALIGKHANESINDLIIIPHGNVWKVNFDLLKSPVDPNVYLIEQYAISYNYSADIWLNAEKLNKSNHEVLAFSFGDSKLGGGNIQFHSLRSKVSELPGTVHEIEAISKIMAGKYFYGNEASESAFKRYAKDYDILHIAVHGEISERNPDESKLIFFNDGDSIEDGELYVKELYQMELNSQLAVLSACNTGMGRVQNGDGILSLGRAFSYAGVPGLLLTRSEVPDISTPIIMQSFYEGLNSGLRKSEALRLAKLKYLNEMAGDLTKDPKYWASFYVLGDNSPITSNRPFWPYALVIVAICLLAFTVLKRSKAKTEIET